MAWFLVGEDKLVSVIRHSTVHMVKPLPLAERLEYHAAGGELCLHSFGPSSREQVRHRIDAAGKGWTGSFSQILTAPRVSLPTDRRYVDVAVPLNGVCGIDQGGTLLCAGQRPLGAGLDGRFAQVVGAGSRICARATSGAVACQSATGLPEKVPPGAYSLLSAGEDHACGIKADRTIACWNTAGALEPTPPGTFARLAPGGGRCAIRDDHRAVCWEAAGPGAGELRVRALEGKVSFVDGSGNAGCAIGDDATAGCWSRGGEMRPLPTQEHLREISVTKTDHWCGITDRGGLICSDHDGPAPSVSRGAPFRKLVSNAVEACALGADGQISCWGEVWPRNVGSRLFHPDSSEAKR
jgi:hypothetical protein